MAHVETLLLRGRRNFVIVGNGIAGVTAAETIRSEDSSAQITIIANDSQPVYYRPALKDYLVGSVQEGANGGGTRVLRPHRFRRSCRV